MPRNSRLWLGMSPNFLSYDPFSFFDPRHWYVAIATLAMPIAVDPETASLQRLVVASTAEECSAVEFSDPLGHRLEEAVGDALFVPVCQCGSP